MTTSVADGLLAPGQTVDLTNCDREQIHIIGAIQPTGFLISLSTDWLVSRVSANAPDFLGRSVEALLGAPFRDVISVEAVHTLRNRISTLQGEDAVERAFGVRLQADGARFDVALHMSTGELVIEAEPSEPEGDTNPAVIVQSMLGRLKRVTNLGDLLREAARQVKALTGYDRVMIYRFHPDGSGEVVAERVRAGLKPFLGLRYPASDIPRQARGLMERNVVRVVADTGAKPAAILPRLSPTGAPLDLSMSTLRIHSPLHLEYLKNMGVQATLTISLLREGRLCGLIACHHMAPRPVSYERRTTAELFAQFLSLLIETRDREVVADYEQRARRLHDGIMPAIVEHGSTASNLVTLSERMREIVPCDGFAVRVGDEMILQDTTPSHEDVTALVRFLDQGAASQLFSTVQLGRVHPPARDYADLAAGVLAIPISRMPRDYLLFFRREIAQSLTWAGDPAKPVEAGPNGVRLTPRKSFEAWREIVRGQCTPWTGPELIAAESLRVTILEVVLRLTVAADRERQAAAKRQDLLIAELNHRVRNILGLIRGLISQSKSGSNDLESFASTLGGRVQALARAHDQITESRWEARSLRTLITTEAAAYLNGSAKRVLLDGPGVLLQPEAFSTVALVIHEMVTNAAKYGSLYDRRGKVTVEWSLEANGDLVIAWREADGPPVQAPTRRGFGTTIIERSIPYDLNGAAHIEYTLHGLQARFVVPANFVEMEGAVVPSGPVVEPVLAVGARLSGTVLLVEDSMIIAMDAEEMLLSLGVEAVHTANDVGEALRLLDLHPPAFAMLDLNIGDQTSIPVANRLRELGIPCFFATGYGDESELPPEHRDSVVIKKPYTAAVIADAVVRANAGWPGLPTPLGRATSPASRSPSNA